MRSKPIFLLSGLGVVLAIVSAVIFSQEPKAQPPVFDPAANPYGKGIYANGIIESEQNQGENVTIYPEVSGPVTAVMVREGAAVRKGDLLLTIDESVQRATAEQQASQAAAAVALLRELKAQPRKETLDVASAQVESAKASLKSAQDSLSKLDRSYQLAPQSVSLDALDTARNAQKVAAANLDVVQRQYDLTRAGAWVYDIQNKKRRPRPWPRRPPPRRRCWRNTPFARRPTGPSWRFKPGWEAMSPLRAPMGPTRRDMAR